MEINTKDPESLIHSPLNANYSLCIIMIIFSGMRFSLSKTTRKNFQSFLSSPPLSVRIRGNGNGKWERDAWMFVKYSYYEKVCRLKVKYVLNLKDVSMFFFKDMYGSCVLVKLFLN